jgi:CelD/BcsL family acetyltransferase involved in cellulose biosynthesis
MRCEIETSSGLHVTAETELPDYWPSASDTGGARCHVFQTREFIAAWLDSFGVSPRLTPWFVTVRDREDNPLMLLPLCIETHQGLGTLRFIDHGNADYNAPVLFENAEALDSATVQQLVKDICALLPGVDMVVLEKVPATVQRWRNPLRWLAPNRDGAAAHGNDLDKPWAVVEKTFGEARNVNRKFRAISRLAETRFVVADTPVMRDRLIGDLLVLKHRRFEQMKVRGFAENPAGVAFLKSASANFDTAGKGLLVALMVGDTTVAVQWGLVHNDAFCGLVTGFALEWADYSCGRILAHQLLRYLYDRGIRYLDQGYGDEPYKLRSSDTTVPLYRGEIAVTPAGRALLAAHQLITRARSSRWWAAIRAARWTISRGVRRRAQG